MKKNELTIIYDGECPFCRDFLAVMRLRESGYEVCLVNARDSNSKLVADISKSFDLDDGMVVMNKDIGVLYGAEAAYFLSDLSRPNTLRGLFYRGFFISNGVAKKMYPILVALRKLYFRLIGKKLIAK